MRTNASLVGFFVDGSNAALVHLIDGIIEQRSTVPSPVFIYGKHGTGKTALLESTAEAMRAAWPNESVRLVHLEEYLSEYIEHIRRRSLADFRATARTQHLLLDGAEFCCGKDGLASEVGHMLRRIADGGHVVMIASAVPLFALPNIADVLRQCPRFVEGRLRPPGPWVRRAIVKRSAAYHGVDLSDRVMVTLVEQHRDGRSLTGAVARHAHASKVLLAEASNH